MYFFGFFSANVDEDFFTPGKLYRYQKEKQLLEGSGILKRNMFWKVTSDQIMFKSPIMINASHPLVYLRIHKCWGCRFHLFLYGDMEVFTLGLPNTTPSDYWEEIKPKKTKNV